MKTKALMCTVALLLSFNSVEAQITWSNIVGTGVVVQDPWFANQSSRVALSGAWCPLSFGLHFEMTGVPVGYSAGPINYESCRLIFDAGSSSLPGAPILGGVFYTPFSTAAQVLDGGGSLYIGPGDTICTGGSGLGVGSTNRQGARFVFGAIPPGNYGALTVQGVLVDGVANILGTTNAINFTIP